MFHVTLYSKKMGQDKYTPRDRATYSSSKPIRLEKSFCPVFGIIHIEIPDVQHLKLLKKDSSVSNWDDSSLERAIDEYELPRKLLLVKAGNALSKLLRR